MKNWLKWLIIVAIVVVSTIFFGSLVLTMLGYIFEFMSTLFSWIGVAVQWLAKVLDIFGFVGILRI